MYVFISCAVLVNILKFMPARAWDYDGPLWALIIFCTPDAIVVVIYINIKSFVIHEA